MPGPTLPAQIAEKLPPIPESADLLVGLGLLVSERPALHAWLRHVAADPAPVAAISYWHANGFAKLILYCGANCRVRLHVWPVGTSPRGEWDPHSHRWDFASTVLAGDGLDIVHHAESAAGTQYTRYIYDGRLIADGLVPLIEVGASEILRDNCYATTSDVIHTVNARGTDLVATLVLQGPHVNDAAAVYRTDGVPDRPSRPISADEVAHLVLQVLAIVDPGGAEPS
ncbi:hypothetical protein [Pseudonocardia lacus]|uniref:hypothetical protein n=1 Tax=Pseudonocardia lacus TaxID=2835865 RepID=UPI001BDC75D3|nr:hypothetical protein [Pseudonocardia lacus]